MFNFLRRRPLRLLVVYTVQNLKRSPAVIAGHIVLNVANGRLDSDTVLEISKYIAELSYLKDLPTPPDPENRVVIHNLIRLDP